MDLRLIRDHLIQAERHVALSDKHIARQLVIIDELERSGHSTFLALDLLHTFRIVRATHLAHRDLIRRELEQQPVPIEIPQASLASRAAQRGF